MLMQIIVLSMIEKASESKLTYLPSAQTMSQSDITTLLISHSVSVKIRNAVEIIRLIRHGEKEINVEKRIDRKKDRILTDKNREICDIYMFYYVGDPDRCLQLSEKRVIVIRTNVTKEAAPKNKG